MYFEDIKEGIMRCYQLTDDLDTLNDEALSTLANRIRNKMVYYEGKISPTTSINELQIVHSELIQYMLKIQNVLIDVYNTATTFEELANL